MKVCPYHTYYTTQAGSGLGNIYRGVLYQKGHGIGNFFKSIFRTVFPLIKSGLQTVGKESLIGTAHFLNDIVAEKSAKDSFKNRIKEVGANLKDKAMHKLEKMIGSGIKRKRSDCMHHNVKRRKGVSKAKAKNRIKKHERDIFRDK